VEREVTELLRADPPDLVVFTGDTVNDTRWWGQAEAWLRTLPARLGRFAVPGNWDYRKGGLAAFCRCVERAGFVPLVNRGVHFREGGRMLCVLGLDDVRYGRTEVRRTLAGHEEEAFRIVLCHNPDVLLGLNPDQFDLLLCGHTHGGQLRLPVHGALWTATRIGKRFEAGLYEPAPGRYVYVSRGLGEGFFKVRFLCPRELARLTLRAILP
jgi:predicted MPP superfamily phosphohydrolase